MHISELDYTLPPDRIATHPVTPRDASRLMVVHAASVEHLIFRDITRFLRAGDLLIVNDTRVLPAKLALRRKSGAAIPGLFLREFDLGTWEVMLRTRGKAAPGETLLSGDFQFQLLARLGDGLWRIQVTPPKPAAAVLQSIGHIPLPPYIERRRKESGTPPETAQDRDWYQTVYAHAQSGSSVAAPTAGLHFTPELLQKIDALSVQRAAVELEVGLGTFLPVETETLEEHKMHTERYRVPAQTITALRAARRENRRIIAVGTTAVRTLEAAAGAILSHSSPTDIAAETNLKISPGFHFQLTDALITNFHLPRSTLMALVAAFLGKDDGLARLKHLYAEAITHDYRFYSYGDAMLIIPQ